MIRQWLFNQPARVIDYLTMIESHWLFGINQPTHQIDYSFSSQPSPTNQLAWSINQLAWSIIRVIDYSAMIQQWLFNQPARVIDYSTMIDCEIDYSFE